MCNKYNGWTNYETWNVKLWGADGMDEYWQERANNGLSARELANEMKDYYQENSPLADEASMYADLLGAALDNANWYEIAQSYIDEVETEEE